MPSDAVSPIMVLDDAQFSQLCEHWNSLDAIGLDTEFMRTNTFYPRIGLLQISDNENCYLIDPLLISEWGSFKELLQSEVTIVLHSCSEDLTLLYSFLGVVPENLFDTQLAAAFLNMGFSLSYQNLVLAVFDKEISKDETRSDWLKRPLTQNQLNYAAVDVLYLLDLFRHLKQRLEDSGKYPWFAEDCHANRVVAIKAEDDTAWQQAYLNFGNAWKLETEQLLVLQRLCYWREVTARGRNKPRSWIAKDNDLFTMAQNVSKAEFSSTRLQQLALTDSRSVLRNASSLCAAMSSDEPKLVDIGDKAPSQPLPPAARQMMKKCQQLSRDIAEQLGMAAEILSRKKQWVEIIESRCVRGENSWPADLDNWRRGVLEQQVLALLNS